MWTGEENLDNSAWYLQLIELVADQEEEVMLNFQLSLAMLVVCVFIFNIILNRL